MVPVSWKVQHHKFRRVLSLILGFSDYQLLTTIITRTIAITEFSVQEALNMFMKLARGYFIKQVVVEVVIFRDLYNTAREGQNH